MVQNDGELGYLTCWMTCWTHIKPLLPCCPVAAESWCGLLWLNSLVQPPFSSMWRVVCQPAQSMKAKWGATNLPSGWNHKLGSKGAQLILNCLLKCGHYSAVATSPTERTGTSRVALALKCRPSKAIREGLNPACLAAESAYTLTWESECISVF